MTDTTIVAMPPPATPAVSVLDWAAILGGAAVAAALSFVLLTFGAAIGLSAVSPYSYSNPSATAVSAAGAFWILVVMIGSFALGGYFAGRFRRVTHTALTVDERTARDGAHGLAMWAVGIMIGAWIAAAAAVGLGRTATAVTGHAAAMAAPAASATAGAVTPDQLAAVTDGLLRADPRANNAQGGEDQRAAVTRIFVGSALRGSMTEDEKTYLVRLVAARSGQNEEQARQRVDAAIAEAKQVAERAKQAADKARKAAIIFAFLIAAGSIVSAGAAYWSATAGGEHRDGIT